jgi:two-component sensor histidine kinase
MEKEVEERFERIEQNLERVSQRMDTVAERMDTMAERMDTMAQRLDRLAEGHIELEAAQKNTTAALNRFVDEVGEKIANLTILVDRRIERDLGRN